MRPAAFERRHRVKAQVPSVSMGDIAFLLLVFFMATTILKTEQGIEVRLPQAETAEKQKKEDVVEVWIDRSGRVWIDGRFVAAGQLRAVMGAVAAGRPGLVVAFNADERAPYQAVSGVLDVLKAVNAVHVSFTSETRRPGGAPPGRR